MSIPVKNPAPQAPPSSVDSIVIPETPPPGIGVQELWRIVHAIRKSVSKDSEQCKTENLAILDALHDLKSQQHTSHSPASFTSSFSPLSSDTSAAPQPPAPPSSSEGSGIPKVCRPHMYDGTISQLRRITSIVEWAHPLTELFHDFCGFYQAFVEHIDDTDKHATALAKVHKLKQEPEPAANYVSRYREIIADLNFDEDSKIDNFYPGLKETVKDAMVIPPHPKTFNDYVKMIISIDNRIHCRQTEVKEHHIKTPNPTSQPRQPPATAHVSHTLSSLSSSDIVPMEVDSMRRGKVMPTERQHRRANNLCYYCGQGTHSVNNCPNMSEHAKRDMRARQAKSTPKADPKSGKAYPVSLQRSKGYRTTM
ncbi:hypothetical protein D9615_006981 [Tricholomella constricta]|uniref:CCHC-type domain-containing protein n=1 Tax=Tricholomella constricta TaxID=117010 RepID=A0A8H5H8W4_9AGAR|nr:hypothetical protein D9615_006981 [Tricholomella constricta]